MNTSKICKIITPLILAVAIASSVSPVGAEAPATDPVRTEIVREISAQERDLTCLADNIYHEARGEGAQGWSAVAHVTMNRVHNQAFPNSVCQVVRARNRKGCQFSWVCTKKGHSTTHRGSELYAEIRKFAQRFLHTRTGRDMTRGALFYHAVTVSPTRWKRARIRETARIGRHIFYK